MTQTCRKQRSAGTRQSRLDARQDGRFTIEGKTSRDLLEQARGARRNAHAPYSSFPVGAALLDSDGRIHLGVNVENASYGLTSCAERTAITRAVADGARSFQGIAIVGPEDDQPIVPCGSCRQVLHEFAPEIEVITPEAGGGVRVTPLRDLLPQPFDPGRLAPREPAHSERQPTKG